METYVLAGNTQYNSDIEYYIVSFIQQLKYSGNF